MSASVDRRMTYAELQARAAELRPVTELAARCTEANRAEIRRHRREAPRIHTIGATRRRRAATVAHLAGAVRACGGSAVGRITAIHLASQMVAVWAGSAPVRVPRPRRLSTRCSAQPRAPSLASVVATIAGAVAT